MVTDVQKPLILQGAGGGKKGSQNADDTLRSFAHARIVDAISEGEIEGLVDGENSILINRTAIPNIKESAWQFRAGLPDDEPFIGIDTTESYQNVGAEVSTELGPVIRTITDGSIDGVKILMQLNTIYRVNTKNGGMKTEDTGWTISVRRAGGSWEEAVNFQLLKEKVTSPTQFEHVIPLTGPAPWDIRIQAHFGERENVEQSISWTGFSGITAGKFTHPHTAMVALALSSEHVGSSTPTRHYHIKGRKILVPTNYDPLTRAYAGVWDGSFKRVWSNNPAWVFYDMVENNIFGIGSHVDVSVVNKWRLYTIAQYCDELVPSGYKDDNDNPILEPRYTFNGVIQNKMEAFDALRSITAVWRGMGFYAMNQFFTTVDMPQDAAHIYGPANVLDGRFEYSTSSVKARHSVVLVRFNDPNNLFEPAIEPYVDDELLKKFGWREKSLELAGCSSRSLAHRYGKWVTETEKSETETATFSVGLDSIHALPGEVIAINDPRRAQARLSGRVAAFSKAQKRVTLDQPVPAGITGSVTLRVQGNDGKLRTLTGSILAGNRSIIVCNEEDPFDVMQQDAVYVLSSTQVVPRLYRIISIDEDTSNRFKITALQYDATKFARVEQGINFDPPPVRLNVTALDPVTNLAVMPRAYVDGGRVRTDLEITWTPSASASVSEYQIYADTPAEPNILVAKTPRSFATYTTYESGAYNFRVFAVSVTGSTSDAATISQTVSGVSSIAVGLVADFVNAATLQGGVGVPFFGPDVRLSWRNMMKVSTVSEIAEVDSEDGIYSHTNLEFYFGAVKVRTQRVKGNSFIYTLDMNRSDAAAVGLPFAQREFNVLAKIVDKDGRVSPETSISLLNSAPDEITPSVQVSKANITVSWQNPSDIDYAGTLVWIKKGVIDPLVDAPVYDGNGSTFEFEGDEVSEYNVRVAHYDMFDKTSLNVSPVVTVTTGRFFVLDMYGNELLSSTGHIGGGAYITVNGSNIALSEVAANSLVPSLNYVGEFSSPPTSVQLGANWRQNAVYKNTVDGKSYILSGTPLAWMTYLQDGASWSLVIESSNGTIFRVGGNQTTLLKARLFKNGAEVTDETPASWFRWRRVSIFPVAPPYDDATFNSLYQGGGYKQLSISVDAVNARATFFCDIISV